MVVCIPFAKHVSKVIFGFYSSDRSSICEFDIIVPVPSEGSHVGIKSVSFQC